MTSTSLSPQFPELNDRYDWADIRQTTFNMDLCYVTAAVHTDHPIYDTPVITCDSRCEIVFPLDENNTIYMDGIRPLNRLIFQGPHVTYRDFMRRAHGFYASAPPKSLMAKFPGAPSPTLCIANAQVARRIPWATLLVPDVLSRGSSIIQNKNLCISN
jgi:hypothetical protein